VRVTTVRATTTPVTVVVVCTMLLFTAGCGGPTSHRADSNPPAAVATGIASPEAQLGPVGSLYDSLIIPHATTPAVTRL
jgi:hypothetical protein